MLDLLKIVRNFFSDLDQDEKVLIVLACLAFPIGFFFVMWYFMSTAHAAGLGTIKDFLPNTFVSYILAGRYGVLVAAFSGGVVSLSAVQKLSVVNMITSIVSGVLTALFVAPAAEEHWNLSEAMVHFFSFVIGIISMSLIRGVMVVADRVNPMAFLPAKFRKPEDK